MVPGCGLAQAIFLLKAKDSKIMFHLQPMSIKSLTVYQEVYWSMHSLELPSASSTQQINCRDAIYPP